MIAWAMLTAPRPTPTIDRSLESFRAAGFTDEVYINREIGNSVALWRDTVTRIANSTDKKYIGMMEDDILWAKDAASILMTEMTEITEIALWLP